MSCYRVNCTFYNQVFLLYCCTVPRHFKKIQMKEHNSECKYKQCNTVLHKPTVRDEVNDTAYQENICRKSEAISLSVVQHSCTKLKPVCMNHCTLTDTLVCMTTENWNSFKGTPLILSIPSVTFLLYNLWTWKSAIKSTTDQSTHFTSYKIVINGFSIINSKCQSGNCLVSALLAQPTC